METYHANNRKQLAFRKALNGITFITGCFPVSCKRNNLMNLATVIFCVQDNFSIRLTTSSCINADVQDN